MEIKRQIKKDEKTIIELTLIPVGDSYWLMDVVGKEPILEETFSLDLSLPEFDDISVIHKDAFSSIVADKEQLALAEKITELKLPNRLSVIKPQAFKGLKALKSLSIPENIEELGFGVLQDCSSLTELDLPFMGLTSTDESNAFLGRLFGATRVEDNAKFVPDSLSRVTIHSQLAPHSFSQCHNLNTVIIDVEAPINIPERAFFECHKLSSLQCSALTPVAGLVDLTGVKTIGAAAFFGCFNIDTVFIDDSYALTIADGAFKNCPQLVRIINNLANTAGGITVEQGSYTNGGIGYYAIEVQEKTLNESGNGFIPCIRPVEPLNGILSIDGDNSECYLFKIEDTDIDNNGTYSINKDVTVIRAHTGYNNPNIKHLNFSANLKEIGAGAFANCPNLESVTFSSADNFDGTSLNNLMNLTKLGANCFDDCPNLTKLNFGTLTNNDIDKIKYPTLTSPSLHYWCSEINFEAPQTLLTNIKILNFDNLEIKHTLDILPLKTEGITAISINAYAFENFKQLEEVNYYVLGINSCISEIGDYAFKNCSNLARFNSSTEKKTSLKMVNKIGEQPFYGCSDELYTYDSVNNLKRIDQFIFGLANPDVKCCTISIPDNNKLDEDFALYIQKDAFKDYLDLEAVYFNSYCMSDWYKIKFESEFSNPMCKVNENLNKRLLVLDPKVTTVRNYIECKYLVLTDLSSESLQDFEVERSKITEDNLDGDIIWAVDKTTKRRVHIIDIKKRIPEYAFCGFNLDEVFYYSKAITTGTEFEDYFERTDNPFIGSSIIKATCFANFAYMIANKNLEEAQILGAYRMRSGRNIPIRAFCDCTNLHTVVMSEIRSVGLDAFKNCTKLSKVYFDGTFSGTYPVNSDKTWTQITFSNLEANPLNNSNCSLFVKSSSGIYYNVSSQEVLNIYDEFLTSYNCVNFKSVKTVRLHQHLTRVDPYIFIGCNNLRQLSYVNSLGYLGTKYFCGVDIDEATQSYKGSYIIRTSDLTVVYGTAGIYKIHKCDFYDSQEGYRKIGPLHVAANAFYKSAITGITLPTTLIDIEQGAFTDCFSLKYISIPFVGSNYKAVELGLPTHFGYIFGATTFHENAQYCPPTDLQVVLTNREINDYTTKIIINDNAFSGCFHLTNVFIDGDIEYLGTNAFADCPKLQVNEKLEDNIKFTFLTSQNQANKVLLAVDSSKLASGSQVGVVLDESVQAIYQGVFRNNLKLSSISGKGVKSIGKSAFDSCYNLQTICFGDLSYNIQDNSGWVACTYIGEKAFYRCTKLSELLIKNDPRSIAAKAFANCTGLSKLFITKDTLALHSTAFDNLTGLKELTAPLRFAQKVDARQTLQYVKVIPSSALSDSHNIPRACFANYTSLRCVEFEKPELIQRIEDFAFYNCTALRTLPFEQLANLKSIGNGAFQNCLNLTYVLLPEACIELPEQTTPPTTPQFVNIGTEAFNNCAKLVFAFFDTTDASTFNSESFQLMDKTGLFTNLKAALSVEGFFVKYTEHNISQWKATEDFNKLYYTIDGYTFLCITPYLANIINSSGNFVEKDTYYLLNAPNDSKELTLPVLLLEGVNQTYSIYDYAFFNNDVVEAVDCAALSTSEYDSHGYPQIDVIGYAAFASCEKLKRVMLPLTLLEIKPYAFQKCTSISVIKPFDQANTVLNGIILPKTLTTIGLGAFADCSQLLSATLTGDSNLKITNPFKNCTQLKELKIDSTLVGERPPYNTVSIFDANSIIYLLLDKTGLLVSTSYVKDTLNLSSYNEADLTYINAESLLNCNQLSTFISNKSLNKIEPYTFANQTHLKKLDLGNCVVECLDMGVCQNCIQLTTVILPSTLQEIYVKAFFGAKELATIQLPDGLTAIHNDAFSSCNFEEFYLPKSISHVGAYILANNKDDLIIYIPEGVLAGQFDPAWNFKSHSTEDTYTTK